MAQVPARRTVWLAPSAYAPHVGGIEETTRRLARALTELGGRVVIITHRYPFDLPAREDIHGTTVHRVAFPAPKATPNGMLDAASDVLPAARALRSIDPQPDVVHVHGASLQLPVLTAFAAWRRVPLVVTTHGEVAADDHGIYDKSRYLRAALRAATLRAARLTAVSVAARDQAAAIAPRFAAARVIPNGVDPAEWPPTPTPTEPVLGAWGRQEYVKGFDVLLAAFEQIRAELPGARLLLGGRGSQAINHPPPGVEPLGVLDRAQIGELLAHSRVVVVPSRIEAFGLVALEAMAAGRTVVWSDLPGIRSATGGLGHPVPPGDAGALATSILRALHGPDDPAPLRAHARTLSWTVAARAYAGLYREVAGR